MRPERPKGIKEQARQLPIRKPAQHASNLIVFRPRVKPEGPQRPDPTSDPSCSRPRMYMLDDYRANIVAAARKKRHYRSIAAQYGVNSLEIWKIVTDELEKAA